MSVWKGRCDITHHVNNTDRLHDSEPEQHTFRQDVLHGLQQVHKELPSKYFYDEVGSRLFDQICLLDEYYLTRTETAIMHEQIHEIVDLLGPDCLLIEYGSGSSTKTRILLEHMHHLAGYVPIDISKDYLYQTAADLSSTYPALEVLPIYADYTREFTIPTPTRPVARRVAYYPGSTIGNFTPAAARQFLQQVARTCAGGGMLIGVDMAKDYNILHRAYNDSSGVTARFNLHLLERINLELHADFQLDQFAHYAFYNPHEKRIEMHLVSLVEQNVCLAEHELAFQRGENIWTENSHKYTLPEFARLAESSGFKVEHVWLDPHKLFSVQYLSTL